MKNFMTLFDFIGEGFYDYHAGNPDYPDGLSKGEGHYDHYGAGFTTSKNDGIIEWGYGDRDQFPLNGMYVDVNNRMHGYGVSPEEIHFIIKQHSKRSKKK